MRVKPNIPKMPYNNRGRLKTLINEVIEDTSLYPFVPDQLVLIDNVITLVLWNKKFMFEDMKVDNPKDYTDIYLQGIKQSSNIYDIGVNGENIVITFIKAISYTQNELTTNDFLVKGKIVSI
jgi:hypothetical protein